VEFSSRKTVNLVGTAILAAMVIVFDYTLKFSGLKIPFPWLPFLKFDFSGIPIVISLLLFGLPSGGFTSAIASLGIIARSGEVIGGLMKGIAEFSTIAGMSFGLRFGKGKKDSFLVKGITFVMGVLVRILVMSLWNIIVLPNYYGIPYEATVGMLPMIAVFNGMQGTLTVVIGYALYEAYTKRVPSTQGDQYRSRARHTVEDCERATSEG
jgi:riboflavin transporter FmnP